jgi:hypothetical protein
VSHPTVSRARKQSTGTNVPVEKRVGLDGKARKLPTPPVAPVIGTREISIEQVTAENAALVAEPVAAPPILDATLEAHRKDKWMEAIGSVHCALDFLVTDFEAHGLPKGVDAIDAGRVISGMDQQIDRLYGVHTLAHEAAHAQWRLNNPEEAAAEDAQTAEAAAEEAADTARQAQREVEQARRQDEREADAQWRAEYPELAAAYDLAKRIADPADGGKGDKKPEEAAADAQWRADYPEEAAEWDAGVARWFAGVDDDTAQHPDNLHEARWRRECPEEAAEEDEWRAACAKKDIERPKREAAEIAKRTKALAKNPEKAKAALRKEMQKDEMDGDIEGAKEDAKEGGECWGDIKDQWIEDWLAENWGEEREAQFLAVDCAEYVRKYGPELPDPRPAAPGRQQTGDASE